MTIALSHFVLYWDAWLVSVFCMVTCISTCMIIAHMPATLGKYLIEKALLWSLCVGSFGVAVGPIFGAGLTPTAFEVLFYGTVGAFSAWLSLPHWCGPLWCDRRRVRKSVAVDRRAA